MDAFALSGFLLIVTGIASLFAPSIPAQVGTRHNYSPVVDHRKMTDGQMAARYGDDWKNNDLNTGACTSWQDDQAARDFCRNDW